MARFEGGLGHCDLRHPKTYKDECFPLNPGAPTTPMGPGVGARGVFVFLAIPLGQAPSGGAGGGAAGEIAKVALMSALRGSTYLCATRFSKRYT